MLVSLRSLAIAFSWASSALALAACTGGPTRVRIGRVVIDAPPSFDAGAGMREAIRAGVEERLSRDDSVRFDSQHRDATHVLHLRIADARARAAEAPRYVLRVRLRPLGDAPLYETQARGDGPEPVAAVLAGFDEAWQLLLRQRRLDREDDAELIAALEDGDARIRDFAIVRLGERKSTAAVAPLVARLQQERDPELVLRSIGSLVAIGDARAVEPLIELGERREPELVMQVVYAVGAIGGRTAEAYLVTIASGHPVEPVRRAAEQALGEMKRAGRR